MNSNNLIPDDFDCDAYIQTHQINSLLGDNSFNDYRQKTESQRNYSTSIDPCPAQYDDLARLHYLVRSRKVLTVLEFGIGKSTIVMADALAKNKEIYSNYTDSNLRRSDPYKIHSIDNIEQYIQIVENELPPNLKAMNICEFYYSECHIGDFQGRICSYYANMPNVCPDMIYLDGPNQFNTTGEIRGIHTRHQDRMPMAADILSIEHFLQPSCLIVVDGRSANARFLKSNLQRSWSYCYVKEFDQHFFELQEPPLGIFNKRMIDFCLGDIYYSRIA